MTTFTARILPLNLRDTDGVDPKVLMKGIMTANEEFRDHCYVSINKNKQLQKFLKQIRKPVLISFTAKTANYTPVKSTLTRVSNIKIVK